MIFNIEIKTHISLNIFDNKFSKKKKALLEIAKMELVILLLKHKA